MAAPEPEPPILDAWGLPVVEGDPPPLSQEIGVTTDGDGWAPPTPTRASVTRTELGLAFVWYGLNKFRVSVLKRGWHRRKL